MRTLVISLALVGCGGLDEAAVPEQTATSVAALEEVLPVVVWARGGGPALQLVQVPVEERYFYPVDVNVPPPELPSPPCPACR